MGDPRNETLKKKKKSKKLYSINNKPTRVSRKNGTIIDNINTNHFLSNNMHYAIMATNISDGFPIFLISKDLLLDSSNDPIHVKKREIKHKSIAYFKTLRLETCG